MNRLILNFLSFWLVFGLIISKDPFQKKEEGERPNSIQAYEQALDVVFPRGYRGTKGILIIATLTMRFRPSFNNEMQLNIVKYIDGSTEAEIHTLPEGSESVSSILETARKSTGNGDLKKIAGSIAVEKRSMGDAETLRQIFRQLSMMQIPAHLSSSITLDGARYELWYKGGSDSYYYSLTNGNSYNGGPHPLVKWMDEVRQSLIQ
jgi:hypothetical protein